MREAQLAGQIGIGIADALEHGAVPVHQIHLVDRHHDVPDAQQARDGAVPLGLGQQLAVGRARGVDQDDRDVGRRGPRDHVARVLLVPWRVGNDEFARRRGEVAIGHVDGDALLPLGFQPVAGRRTRPCCHTAGGRSAWTCRRRRSPP
ncbi:hypothetical protein G6F22_018981 [Rhizopus arrhizus]|nr:hypothetical protein G6F22_018981 [Rhizopus arrhizus]